MGAPIGNQNAAKAKKWTAAIERALAKRAGGDINAAMDEAAEFLLGLVWAGDLGAIKELGDRLEGKPKQQIDPEDGAVTRTLTEILLEMANARRPTPATD